MNKYFLSYLESGKETYGEPPYVIEQREDGFVQIVPEDNPNYVAWLAQGNTPEVWNPESETK